MLLFLAMTERRSLALVATVVTLGRLLEESQVLLLLLLHMRLLLLQWNLLLQLLL